MKTILILSILFSLIALPVLGQLTDADLDKIRLIVKEEVKASEKEIKEEVKTSEKEIKTEIAAINSKLDGLDARLRNVETGVAELRGRNIGTSVLKDWGVALCALSALIVSIIALRKTQPKLPQRPQDVQKSVSQ